MAKRKKNITLFDDQIKRGNQICNRIDRNFSQMVGELIDEKHAEIVIKNKDNSINRLVIK